VREERSTPAARYHACTAGMGEVRLLTPAGRERFQLLQWDRPRRRQGEGGAHARTTPAGRGGRGAHARTTPAGRGGRGAAHARTGPQRRHGERAQGEGAAHDPSATACTRWIQSRGHSPAPPVVAVRRVMVHKPKLQCGPHFFFCRRWRGGEKILGDDVASRRFTARSRETLSCKEGAPLFN
jgi:hypothetical protein